MIQLSRSVDNPRIVPATLSPLNSYTAAGLPFNIAGWGVGVDDRVSRFLRTVQVTAISLIQCGENLSTRYIKYHMDSEYMCTVSNPPAKTTCVSTLIDFS